MFVLLIITVYQLMQRQTVLLLAACSFLSWISITYYLFTNQPNHHFKLSVSIHIHICNNHTAQYPSQSHVSSVVTLPTYDKVYKSGLPIAVHHIASQAFFENRIWFLKKKLHRITHRKFPAIFLQCLAIFWGEF